MNYVVRLSNTDSKTIAAEKYEVEDGYLWFLDATGGMVATVSMGQWIWVEVQQPVAG